MAGVGRRLVFHRLLTEADNRTFWHGLSRRPFSMENAAPEPNFILVYVENPARSASFYARILGRDPVESSAIFVLFKLDSGGMLGLWGRLGVEPSATNPGGGKLTFALNDDRAVDRLRAEWSGLGIPMIQPPPRMGFGYIFTATDPDGHRLRVFSSS